MTIGVVQGVSRFQPLCSPQQGRLTQWASLDAAGSRLPIDTGRRVKQLADLIDLSAAMAVDQR
jgi:hypothetical protein